jgi:hypothetical protein
VEKAFPAPLDSLDREFKEHLAFVFNQALQNLRKTGWTKETLENVGRLLFRLYQVFQAYKTKKKAYTPKEWVDKLLTLGKDINDAFRS